MVYAAVLLGVSALASMYADRKTAANFSLISAGIPRLRQLWTRWGPYGSRFNSLASFVSPPSRSISSASLMAAILYAMFKHAQGGSPGFFVGHSPQTSAMHESAERLYKAAKLIKGLDGQTAVAVALQQSPQTVYNWERRGVSEKGALLVESLWGVSPNWIMRGAGQMTASAPATPTNMGADVTNTDTSDMLNPMWRVNPNRSRVVWVVGRGAGGSMSERLWTDGDYPLGATEDFAEIATADPHAFLVEVVGTSMVPRYNPGEFALVEPETEPEIDDDVLVRLKNGETMLKRLASRSSGYRFGSYNNGEILHFKQDEVSWVYYVAHPVPRRKIKSRM